MIARMVIFGAAGDLTSRYLAPALARLQGAGKLAADFTVLGVSREDWDSGTFRRYQAHRLERYAASVDKAARAAWVERLKYRRADVTDQGQVTKGGRIRPSVIYGRPRPFRASL